MKSQEAISSISLTQNSVHGNPETQTAPSYTPQINTARAVDASRNNLTRRETEFEAWRRYYLASTKLEHSRALVEGGRREFGPGEFEGLKAEFAEASQQWEVVKNEIKVETQEVN